MKTSNPHHYHNQLKCDVYDNIEMAPEMKEAGSYSTTTNSPSIWACGNHYDDDDDDDDGNRHTNILYKLHSFNVKICQAS